MGCTSRALAYPISSKGGRFCLFSEAFPLLTSLTTMQTMTCLGTQRTERKVSSPCQSAPRWLSHLGCWSGMSTGHDNSASSEAGRSLCGSSLPQVPRPGNAGLRRHLRRRNPPEIRSTPLEIHLTPCPKLSTVHSELSCPTLARKADAAEIQASGFAPKFALWRAGWGVTAEARP